MPRAGLTSEPNSSPFELRIADLKESIKAVTWGSLQIEAEPPGDVAGVPAGGVTTPGVSGSGVEVAINKVEVGNASGVGVGAAGVEGAGNVHPASNVNVIKIAERALLFMFISSFDNYIPLI
jgi:hypothetical protein